MDKRFDVIIVGSGAGGGTLARCLAPSGKSMLRPDRDFVAWGGGHLGFPDRDDRREPRHI
jgi:pyruvate/2-oxoglutarate dehydrogenase complex dihydrolipoamide dehydrogenase (E3) component